MGCVLPVSSHISRGSFMTALIDSFSVIYHFLFSLYVMSDSLRLHGLLHARLPCLSLSPSLLKLMSIESVRLSNHLILIHHLNNNIKNTLQSTPTSHFITLSSDLNSIHLKQALIIRGFAESHYPSCVTSLGGK